MGGSCDEPVAVDYQRSVVSDPMLWSSSFVSFDAVAMESPSGLPKRLKNSPPCKRFLLRLCIACT